MHCELRTTVGEKIVGEKIEYGRIAVWRYAFPSCHVSLLIMTRKFLSSLLPCLPITTHLASLHNRNLFLTTPYMIFLNFIMHCSHFRFVNVFTYFFRIYAVPNYDTNSSLPSCIASLQCPGKGWGGRFLKFKKTAQLAITVNLKSQNNDFALGLIVSVTTQQRWGLGWSRFLLWKSQGTTCHHHKT
jgi:hypothetical protein